MPLRRADRTLHRVALRLRHHDIRLHDRHLLHGRRARARDALLAESAEGLAKLTAAREEDRGARKEHAAVHDAALLAGSALVALAACLLFAVRPRLA